MDNLLELLDYINPAACDYQEWINVGMALKHEGFDVSDWDAWSLRDPARYRSGNCEKKWQSFNGSASPVTAGTIVQMARDGGWRPAAADEALEWDSVIGTKDDLVVVKEGWVEGREITEPEKWEPVRELTTYLQTLFEPNEIIGYVTETWQNEDGKYLPTKGVYSRTAGEIIEQLSKCGGDIGAAIGDYSADAGAWIRFNPLDGKGVRNDNVTEYRYALVESDSTDIAKQNQILHELELPIAALVYSGGKSLHAVVRIEAADYDEYRKRVDYLYEVCKKNGLEVDRQNKNPSRLSRMPGVTRSGKKQFLVETNTGKASFTEWKEWIEAVNDNLPDPESLEAFWDNMPDLASPLIDGILRQGHKMLLAGPSKAGKSFALIELTIAIAEGVKWFGFRCTQGRVLYVNLELDRASCLHRFKDVYGAMRLEPDSLGNIDIWNLRGNSIPMDKLAPKLIRRAAKRNYIAIIIDPIYKVITGDENSADQMAHFCNQFDKVCTELGCAVIYCHHHSKGAQGGKKSMDRASGSGVFARDPDAILDLIELETNEDLMKEESNRAVCKVCMRWADRWGVDYSEDDSCNERDMLSVCRGGMSEKTYRLMLNEVATVRQRMAQRTAWRIEGTLREFPKFPPLNLWFDFPAHHPDDSGVLKDLASDETNSKQSPYKKNFSKKKSAKEKAEERRISFDNAFSFCAEDGEATVAELAEYMGTTEKTVRSRVKEFEIYGIENNVVYKK